jgi:hypothetical protein
MATILPNCEQAIVEDRKLLNYLLDEEKSEGKTYFYNRLGFFQMNYRELAESLRVLACAGDVIVTIPAKFGLKYQVVGQLNNPYQRDALVLSIWIFDLGSDVPRLVTAYPY